MRNYEVPKTSELRRPMDDFVDMPLYTIHMGPEYPSTWDFDRSSPPIPKDVFGQGSDPWSGTIACIGDPYNPKGPAPSADLIVRHEKIHWVRNKSIRYGPPEIPDRFQLRCDMVELSEVGIKPVVVTYDNGKRSEKWKVRIQLAKRHPGGGLIYITHINQDGNGGYADIEIAVKVSFIFSKKDEEVVVDSAVEWLSETNHRFVRWMDKKSAERFYISDESNGNFIPATASIDGDYVVMAGCSKNHSVVHSFILPPMVNEVRDSWGSFKDVWQFSERMG